MFVTFLRVKAEMRIPEVLLSALHGTFYDAPLCLDPRQGNPASRLNMTQARPKHVFPTWAPGIELKPGPHKMRHSFPKMHLNSWKFCFQTWVTHATRIFPLIFMAFSRKVRRKEDLDIIQNCHSVKNRWYNNLWLKVKLIFISMKYKERKVKKEPS
jgi:hypothetical protein